MNLRRTGSVIVAPNKAYMDSPQVQDWGPVGRAPAVVYPASVVSSVEYRADMESASPLRQSIQAAFFSKVLVHTQKVQTVLELGSNIDLNLMAPRH